MHFEFLVEDASGKKFVEEIVPKIVDTNSNTYVVHSYKGIGRIPPHLNEGAHPKHRFLLSQLPKLLNGLGKTFAGYGQDFEACVVVVCDLDTKDFAQFRGELNSVLENCHTPPTTRFCVAIEEGEAWLLGTHPRKAALLRSEANWMFCLYGRQYRQCEKRGFNDREAAAS